MEPTDPKRGGQGDRRSFFRVLAGIASAPLWLRALRSRGIAGEELPACTDLNAVRGSYWNEGGTYFVQPSVDASLLEQGVLRARVDGRWGEFMVSNLSEEFFQYNIEQRIRMINVMMGTEPLEMYNDAHNAAVATYGANRGDSRFSLNVAFKGMGWVPKPDVIQQMADEFYELSNASMMAKIAKIKSNYANTDLWRRDVLGSHELYTSRDFETHTFLNQMENPVSVICTLADRSYEFRTICRLLHPGDPGLSPRDYDIVRWVNYAHDFFHGSPTGELTVHRIVALYHMVETFDNSPWGMTPTAGGMQLVPKM
ncbi:MAG: hypothetical protein FJ098_06485 [Deltaproteobacteria bacterium]|nr:hypothetical protein [Deltaproteobacteria bacterium]